MSGQSSLILLVGIIAVVLVVWISNRFSEVSLQSRLISSEKLNKITKYLDFVKGVSKDSLVLSAHQGTYEVARKNMHYICNDPVPPSTNEIRYELSESTKRILNRYIDNIQISDESVKADVSGYNCVDYPVDNMKLNVGILDENFPVSAYGSKIEIVLDENKVSSKNDISESVVRDRFWFMYRKFKDWSRKSKFTELVCENCMDSVCNCQGQEPITSCGDCPELLQCVRDKVVFFIENELDEIFSDPYVECSGEVNCCYAETEDCVPRYDGCLVWDKENECMQCDEDRSENVCVENILERLISGLQGGNAYAQTTTPNQWWICENWKEARVAVNTIFTCVDKKYELSIPSVEDRYLKYTVQASIALRKSPACYSIIGPTQTRTGCDVCSPTAPPGPPPPQPQPTPTQPPQPPKPPGAP